MLGDVLSVASFLPGTPRSSSGNSEMHYPSWAPVHSGVNARFYYFVLSEWTQVSGSMFKKKRCKSSRWASKEGEWCKWSFSFFICTAWVPVTCPLTFNSHSLLLCSSVGYERWPSSRKVILNFVERTDFNYLGGVTVENSLMLEMPQIQNKTNVEWVMNLSEDLWVTMWWQTFSFQNSELSILWGGSHVLFPESAGNLCENPDHLLPLFPQNLLVPLRPSTSLTGWKVHVRMTRSGLCH